MYLEGIKRWLAADLEDADLNPELARIEGNDEGDQGPFCCISEIRNRRTSWCNLAQEQTV